MRKHVVQNKTIAQGGPIGPQTAAPTFDTSDLIQACLNFTQDH